ncbi:Methyltransferase srdJ [Cladobotryum mycophilum]|uniref:Methyltransferase srdJ n=1 Tax=Cladobotryum mycophilum TaxID=491253 RepID=A0ABR0SYA8_9HYPO
MPADFDKQSYWHNRFSTESSFEWLSSSEEFMFILQPYLSKLHPSSARILHLGSGTSDLQNHLRRLGFVNVTNVDYEPLAIERGRQMEEKSFGDVRMRYLVADATQLFNGDDGFQRHEKFDLVVDKSTADAVSCGGEEPLLSMASCIKDCLAKGAAWISMSYSSYRFDVDHLPFHVQVIAQISTPKAKETDPDIHHSCYLLRPK